MEELKPWYMSRTIWGGLVAAGAAFGGLFGLSLEGADQAALTEALLQAVGAAGAVVAILGRLAATSRVF
jgi:hypothetical protein